MYDLSDTCFVCVPAEDGALLGKIEKVRVLKNDRREGNEKKSFISFSSHCNLILPDPVLVLVVLDVLVVVVVIIIFMVGVENNSVLCFSFFFVTGVSIRTDAFEGSWCGCCHSTSPHLLRLSL